MISEHLWKAFDLHFQMFQFLTPFPFTWDPSKKRLHRKLNKKKVQHSNFTAFCFAVVNCYWAIYFLRAAFFPNSKNNSCGNGFMLTTMAIAQVAVTTPITAFALFYTLRLEVIIIMFNDTIMKFQDRKFFFKISLSFLSKV